jgi:hypothetical protein
MNVLCDFQSKRSNFKENLTLPEQQELIFSPMYSVFGIRGKKCLFSFINIFYP